MFEDSGKRGNSDKMFDTPQYMKHRCFPGSRNQFSKLIPGTYLLAPLILEFLSYFMTIMTVHEEWTHSDLVQLKQNSISCIPCARVYHENAIIQVSLPMPKSEPTLVNVPSC